MTTSSNSSTAFFALTEYNITQAMCDILVPRLREHILSRAAGHCMRVAHLDLPLMIELCHALRAACPDAQIAILKENGGTAYSEKERELFITSTKLVELRNPLPGGALRPPLLVFLPANLHASAEDSFGVATFEDISVTTIYDDLRDHLLQRFPPQWQGSVRDLLLSLKNEHWHWADQVAQMRFLLTIMKNGIDAESLGGSLYELGLVPDLELFKDLASVHGRIYRNLEAVRKITYSDASMRGRVLEIGLSEKPESKLVQRQLISLLSDVGLDPHTWTRQIALVKANRAICFDKWQFIDDISSDKIMLFVTKLGLEEAKDDSTNEQLADLSGQKVLNLNSQTKFSITFQVDPYPVRVSSLAYFTVQILTVDGEPVGNAKRVKAWTSKRNEQSVSLDKLDKLDFENGWHIVRVLPWTKNDEPIPLANAPRDNENRAKPNESEQFYVVHEGEIVDPPQRAVNYEYSLEHAKLRVQFKMLSEQNEPSAVKVTQVEWIGKTSKARQAQQEILEVKLEHGGKYHVLVSHPLKTLEREILSNPRRAAAWSWRANVGTGRYSEPQPTDTPLPGSADSFLAARERYFAAINASEQGKEPILQSVDLSCLYHQSIDYVDAYRELLSDLARTIEQSHGGKDQQRAILALRTVLMIDTVHLTLIDMKGRARETTLVGPMHPLRALWFTTWARVAQQWLYEVQAGQNEYLTQVRDGLLRGLSPLNIPATLPNTDGRVFVMVDNITPFWSLYAPATEEDTRGLLGDVCTLLGLPEPAIGGDTISAELLASRIGRYLIQHPYIRTLCINAFHPGRAEVLAQALVLLQKQNAFSSLRYEIRLFVPDPAVPRVGEAIEALLTPTTTVSTEAADVFSTPGTSHLFPKLSLAIHALTDFSRAPQRYRAHLSMLFDLFPAEEVGAGPAFNSTETSPLYALLQDFTTRFQDDDLGTFWRRQPRHGSASLLPQAEIAIDLLAGLSEMLSGMVATIATGNPVFEQRPIITLALTTEHRELIHYVHEISDWVLTIDRNIGIEFFDHGGRDERPAYLIDYIPASLTGSGHRLITTSRALLELRATLQPVLQQHQLAAGDYETTLILQQLRALSGRLALKLISSSTHQSEALGLALARLFLLQQGALSNQLILPLDTHLDLFYSARNSREEMDEAVTLQRTDLALFDLNAATRTIHCNLVEVKCYASTGSLSAYTQLKERVAEQLTMSEEVLRRHFDLQRKTPDRPDRLLKTRELFTLLEFYLGRSRRYGLMHAEVDEEAQYLLATLEEGYTLRFTRCALIFAFDQVGTALVDNEGGIEYYHIGRDQIEALIAEPAISKDKAQSTNQTTNVNASSSLPSAAFLAPERDHSTSWRRRSRYLYDESNGEAGDISPSPDEPLSQIEVSLPNLSLQEPLLHIQSPSLEEQERVEEQVEDFVPAEQQPIVAIPPIDTPYQIMLGVQHATPQYGILGEVSGNKVALDLNQTHTISLFGVQGSGKSYTLGSIVEMACLPISHINTLPRPLATVIFHYSPTQDYKPEFTSMIAPNSEASQIAQLRERYGAIPQALRDVVLLTPTSKVAERQREYPGIEVLPITFAASELKAVHWKFLMNAINSQSLYVKQISLIMKKLRDKLTLEALQQEVANAPMSDHLKELAQMRLQFAAEYIDDSRKLTDAIRPGRLLIVDIRDEFIEKDEALGLFVVLLQIFSEATYAGETFNKLVVFDEAHKYIGSTDLVAGLIEVVREMRHKGTSIMVASQDPPSVPISLIELSTQIILHRCNSPMWLKHIQKANSALNALTAEKMSHLGSGEAYVWSAKATDDAFTRSAIKVKCRPRVTQHGGGTKTAVD